MKNMQEKLHGDRRVYTMKKFKRTYMKEPSKVFGMNLGLEEFSSGDGHPTMSLEEERTISPQKTRKLKKWWRSGLIGIEC